MGKYSSNAARKPAPPPAHKRMSAGMRGIGCILFVVVPIVSFEVAKLIANGPARTWGFMPPAWFNAPLLHPALAQLGGIRTAWDFLVINLSLTTANIIFTFAMTIVIYGFNAILFGYLFSMLAPSRYGPTDVPPPRVKTKKYTR